VNPSSAESRGQGFHQPFCCGPVWIVVGIHLGHREAGQLRRRQQDSQGTKSCVEREPLVPSGVLRDGQVEVVDHVHVETFYTMEVNGITLVNWVEALIAAEPLGDVHCDECVTP
jgi:hypothetical protein